MNESVLSVKDNNTWLLSC